MAEMLDCGRDLLKFKQAAKARRPASLLWEVEAIPWRFMTNGDGLMLQQSIDASRDGWLLSRYGPHDLDPVPTINLSAVGEPLMGPIHDERTLGRALRSARLTEWQDLPALFGDQALAALRRWHPGIGRVPSRALTQDSPVARLIRAADAAGHIIVGVWPPATAGINTVLLGTHSAVPGSEGLREALLAAGISCESLPCEELLREKRECRASRTLMDRNIPHACLLPGRLPGASAAQYLPRLRQAAWPESRTDGRPLVLVADDEHDIAVFIKDFLENKGFEVRIANNGREALELCRKFKPDLALLNHLMPIMTGVEACAKLRATPDCEWIRIFVYSGYPGSMMTPLAAEAGADGFFQSPFDPAQLLMLLVHAMQP